VAENEVQRAVVQDLAAEEEERTRNLASGENIDEFPHADLLIPEVISRVP